MPSIYSRSWWWWLDVYLRRWTLVFSLILALYSFRTLIVTMRAFLLHMYHLSSPLPLVWLRKLLPTLLISFDPNAANQGRISAVNKKASGKRPPIKTKVEKPLQRSEGWLFFTIVWEWITAREWLKWMKRLNIKCLLYKICALVLCIQLLLLTISYNFDMYWNEQLMGRGYARWFYDIVF